MTAPIIPAGAADLADRLAVWRTVINSKLTGGIVFKTSDTSRSSANTGATHTTDPHLSTPVLANSTYVVEIDLNATVGAGGFKVQCTAPSGTFRSSAYHWNNGTAAIGFTYNRITASASPHGTSGFAGGANGGTPMRWRFTLFVGATGGTLAFQWAQDAANAANTTVEQGGWMRASLVA